MRKWHTFRVAMILMSTLAGCGDNNAITGPGFVGIDDSTVNTAPLLTVTYNDPVFGPVTAQILSDPLSDGDIAFDPVRSVFTISSNVTPLFFGVDSSNSNLPEYRAFLTFPLDGVTGQDVVPSGVPIISATVELFVTEVGFAGTVPTFLDLVPYGVLDAGDFDAAFLDFRSLDFFSSDTGNFVLIDVTPIMQTAQIRDLFDFQIRLSLDFGVSVAGVQAAGPQAVPKQAYRTVSPFSITGKRPTRVPREGGLSSGVGAGRPARMR